MGCQRSFSVASLSEFLTIEQEKLFEGVLMGFVVLAIAIPFVLVSVRVAALSKLAFHVKKGEASGKIAKCKFGGDKQVAAVDKKALNLGCKKNISYIGDAIDALPPSGCVMS
jgi:hypothetical protein